MEKKPLIWKTLQSVQGNRIQDGHSFEAKSSIMLQLNRHLYIGDLHEAQDLDHSATLDPKQLLLLKVPVIIINFHFSP